MATIKSFTSVPQSRKLAEFLPLESADYCWGIDEKTLCYNNSPYPCPWKDYTAKQYYVPCWSLAALLDILPRNLNIGRPSLNSNYKGYYWIQYYDEFMKPNDYKTKCFDNPIDVCYEMILKLHELKML